MGLFVGFPQFCSISVLLLMFFVQSPFPTLWEELRLLFKAVGVCWIPWHLPLFSPQILDVPQLPWVPVGAGGIPHGVLEPSLAVGPPPAGFTPLRLQKLQLQVFSFPGCFKELNKLEKLLKQELPSASVR